MGPGSENSRYPPYAGWRWGQGGLVAPRPLVKASGGHWAQQAAPGGEQVYGGSVWWHGLLEGGWEHRDCGCSRLFTLLTMLLLVLLLLQCLPLQLEGALRPSEEVRLSG